MCFDGCDATRDPDEVSAAFVVSQCVEGAQWWTSPSNDVMVLDVSVWVAGCRAASFAPCIGVAGMLRLPIAGSVLFPLIPMAVTDLVGRTFAGRLQASCLWLHCCDGDFGDLERLIQFFGACRLEVASRMVCIGS
ncbi:hypothetical protein Nepgr_032138 [Nepenthes gracilis]|uniref:Uncharacterized protein n=1 Tax=Nepenthes gracilis TaxID=150966 RepID=A0AAD3TIR1_NEPGR|nr:hypothetical protein Nepgr_032138 [Nepenthes gracilis]